jgi:large subunit ribosomal protein L15
MNLTELNLRAGRYKTRKRVGRGTGSGTGKTSGRGHKGARSRSGFKRRPSFEGGAMPGFRKFPKRGFNNVFRTLYDVVNIGFLDRFEDGSTVTLASLVDAGFIKNPHGKLKILGNGQLDKKLTVEAVRFTVSARRRIEELGGEARVV